VQPLPHSLSLRRTRRGGLRDRREDGAGRLPLAAAAAVARVGGGDHGGHRVAVGVRPSSHLLPLPFRLLLHLDVAAQVDFESNVVKRFIIL
jgi:hypothetical protein